MRLELVLCGWLPESKLGGTVLKCATLGSGFLEFRSKWKKSCSLEYPPVFKCHLIE